MGFRNSEDCKRETDGITYYVRKNVAVQGCEFERFAIQTHFIEQGESYLDVINKYVVPLYEQGDVLSISEKIISMCQNNTVNKSDVKLGFWAKFLSKFASSNSHGIAMDEPYKLQLAINLAGLPRILFACFCSAVTKLFGIKGVFYKIAGHEIDGIDGFYMNSSFDLYHNLALLNPKNPSKVCNEISDAFNISSMIVDANDFEVNVLGKSDSLKGISDEFLKLLIKDNPAGQSDELTPLILIKNVAKKSEKQN
ncbi:MAG: F420-0--gamma-glutamyl ligase [Clostridia bacterium]|nr:F420-0--gamma-glutamyl ligase [Clostridia bacterium]